MAELDLNVAPEHIADFFLEAKRALQSGRDRALLDPERSTHMLHSAVSAGETDFPIIVVLEVRRRKTKAGRAETRVFLVDVRPPEGDEVTEGGYGDLVPWPAELKQCAWSPVAHALRGGAQSVKQPAPLIEFRRDFLAFYGTRLGGKYRIAGWRLSPPAYPAESGLPPSAVSEQVIACDRDVAGRDAMDISMKFMNELERLGLLLTVFWCIQVRPTPHSPELRWVHEPQEGSEPRSSLRYLGFWEAAGARPSSMPPLGALTPGPTARRDRLNPALYSGQGGDFVPPEDAMALLEHFYTLQRTEPLSAERFLSAAMAYQTSLHVQRVTLTGGLAYLVVAAEALVEEDFPTCPACKQKTGLARAVQDLVFRELPCLREREAEVKRLLRLAYEIRSTHFHTGRRAAGELETWQSRFVEEPAWLSILTIVLRVRAVLNALLVAWLVSRATGAKWPRASEPMPARRTPKYEARSLSVKVPAGGTVVLNFKPPPRG